MKFPANKKMLLVPTLAILAVLIVSFFLLNKDKKEVIVTEIKKQEEQKQEQEKTDSLNEGSAGTGGQTQKKDENSTANPESPTDNLKDVSLKGTLNEADNYSISITLLGDKGLYTVEKENDGIWSTVVDSKLYSGVGGLSLDDKLLISETQRNYRVYRIADGKKFGPKEISVDRNLVVSGGGITNFPGAL